MNKDFKVTNVDDLPVSIFYLSVAFDDDEIMVYLRISLSSPENLKLNIDETPKEVQYDIVFISPVLHSSDGEVRTFGFTTEFLQNQELLFSYSISKSVLGTQAYNKFVNYDWVTYSYFDITTSKRSDVPFSKHIRNYRKKPIDLSGIGDIYNMPNKIFIYYLYTKFIYGNDLTNIETKDSNFIKYVDKHTKLTQPELEESLRIFNDRIYLPYTLVYADLKKVIKITPVRHDTEWIVNKFFYYMVFYSDNESIIITLPSYQYFKYAFNIGDFLVNDKLLFKLKFSNTKVMETNVYIGNNMGKSVYQNLLDIKNNAVDKIMKFDDVDYHNLIVMNILNMRFMHLCGIIHNDLHLNNILFKREPEYIPHEYAQAIAYKLRYAYKHWIFLSKIDFTIIDFGRACFIDDKDAILKRIKKINNEFYTTYLHKINMMFEEDLKMTGYVMSMFDYIEYMQSISTGYKWINDENMDFEKLQLMVSYCYDIIIAYLTGGNKKLTSELSDILELGHYRHMPEMMFKFTGSESNELHLFDLWDMVIPENNGHPIDLVIKKFYPENVMDESKTIDQFGKIYERRDQ